MAGLISSAEFCGDGIMHYSISRLLFMMGAYNWGL